MVGIPRTVMLLCSDSRRHNKHACLPFTLLHTPHLTHAPSANEPPSNHVRVRHQHAVCHSRLLLWCGVRCVREQPGGTLVENHARGARKRIGHWGAWEHKDKPETASPQRALSWSLSAFNDKERGSEVIGRRWRGARRPWSPAKDDSRTKASCDTGGRRGENWNIK